jgi:hypothetical protein
MTPEDQIRMLRAADTWRKIHRDAPAPFDVNTGYDQYGLVGLSEDEMRRRTTQPSAQYQEPDYEAMGMTPQEYEAMLAREADRQRRQGYIRSVTKPAKAKHMWHPEHDDRYAGN